MDVLDHLKVAYSFAQTGRAEARALLEAGFHGPAFVWAVRASETLMRDYVLAPHFMEEGTSWSNAMRKGSKILGSSDWRAAFAKAEEWYGPFDEPLTVEGDNAWNYWEKAVVRIRGDIVHGRPVPIPTVEEATSVCDFADRMATWYAQRFMTSDIHPLGREFRRLLRTAAEEHARLQDAPDAE